MSDYNHFRSNNSKFQYYPHQRHTTVNRRKCLVNLIFVNDYFAMTMDSNSILSIRTYFSICFFFGYFATWFWYKTDNLRKMKNYFFELICSYFIHFNKHTWSSISKSIFRSISASTWISNRKFRRCRLILVVVYLTIIFTALLLYWILFPII
jgi:hypothetical protein